MEDTRRDDLLHLFLSNISRVPFIRDGLIARGLIDEKLLNTSKVLQDQQILEVGCGGGILTEQLARLGANVKGIDLSPELIEVAQKHLNETEQREGGGKRIQDLISYEIISIEEHSQQRPDYYNALILSEVIEHIDDKVAFLNSSIQCLKVSK